MVKLLQSTMGIKQHTSLEQQSFLLKKKCQVFERIYLDLLVLDFSLFLMYVKYTSLVSKPSDSSVKI